MTSYRRLINSLRFRLLRNRRGVALFMVLTSMATLAIFVGEITYTAQVNQKLAYDKLDQVKAHALAKSGLRLALLRIRAYAEIKRTIGNITGSAAAAGGAAAAAAVSSQIPQGLIEKVWNQAIAIPFTGDLSGLPSSARDALAKFRKDSSMEGKLYMTIQAQSSKFNLNSVLSTFAPSPTPAKNTGGGTGGSAGGTTGGATGGTGGTGGNAAGGANPAATPVVFDSEVARDTLTNQIEQTLARKFEEDQRFRDRYRNLRAADLADEILGWNDLTFQSQAAQRSNEPFKQAPFYDISELRYLPSMDDDLFNVLEAQFTAGVNSAINVNTIQEPVLQALIPTMIPEERKRFFEFRDNTGGSGAAGAQGGGGASGGGGNAGGSAGPQRPPNEIGFKTPDDFFKYIKENVATFANSQGRADDLRNQLTQRGITITTEESQFIVRIEATVQQTKRTLEAWVTLLPDQNVQNRNNNLGGPNTPGTNPANAGANPGGANNPVNNPNIQNPNNPQLQRSNLKITQLRFL